MHALLNHLCTRRGGGQAFLEAIHRGEASTRPESFLQGGPSKLLLDFYSFLPDHQINIPRRSTALSSFKAEVDNTAASLKAQMVDVYSNPALMLNFTPSIPGVAYVDLTQQVMLNFTPSIPGVAYFDLTQEVDLSAPTEREHHTTLEGWHRQL